MQGTKKLTLLAGAAVTTAALAVPAGASAAAANCNKPMTPPPGATNWTADFNGGLDGSAFWKGGSLWADGHGTLAVGFDVYPAIPQPDTDCDFTDGVLTYPWKTLDGFQVRRRVDSVGGQVRHLDEFHNPTGAQKMLNAQFGLQVNGGQVIVETESGDASANDDDHWSVHETDGTAFQFLQWGEDSQAHDPDVKSAGPNPEKWEHEAGSMPDGGLVYTGIPVPANSSVRLLHISGAAEDQASAEAAAKNGAAPFAGLTKTTARTVVNWGDDPDKDGVGKFLDDCPSVKGNGANGCQQFVFIPPPAGGDQPAPPAGDTGTPAGPAPTPPAPPATPATPSSADRTAPKITLSGIGRRVKRSKLTGKGLSARLRCDETCTLNVKVQVRRRGAKKAATVLTARPARSGALKLKVKGTKLRRLSRQRVTLLVTATDQAGNRRTLTKTVGLS